MTNALVTLSETTSGSQKMNEYNPDRWVILKLINNQKTIYKVLGGWFGGYLQGDSWRINSGITKVELDGDVYKFYGPIWIISDS